MPSKRLSFVLWVAPHQQNGQIRGKPRCVLLSNSCSTELCCPLPISFAALMPSRELHPDTALMSNVVSPGGHTITKEYNIGDQVRVRVYYVTTLVSLAVPSLESGLVESWCALCGQQHMSPHSEVRDACQQQADVRHGMTRAEVVELTPGLFRSLRSRMREWMTCQPTLAIAVADQPAEQLV
eukprot:4899978-Amphidinium_carterae.1